MALTIRQALEKAVDAHRSNNLALAKQVYHKILNVQPDHLDANHNLGRILISYGKIDEAIRFLYKSVNKSPKVEQFWVSYIEAVTEEGLFGKARESLQRARCCGLSADKAALLKSRLEAKKQACKVSKSNISQKNLRRLVQYFNAAKYAEALNLALSLTQVSPEHALPWKILGTIFGLSSRVEEALKAHLKALNLAPSDAENHNNLGATLTALNRFEEAEWSFQNALSLVPNFADALYNLGIAREAQNNLLGAEESYVKAVSERNSYFQAYNNLGNVNKKLKKNNEAKANYARAIIMNTGYKEAYFNLATLLIEQDNILAARLHLSKAVILDKNYEDACYMLEAINGNAKRPPQKVFEKLFDSYAATFEKSLVDELGYRMPAFITKSILDNNKQRPLGSVLDLGCGTGLFGQEIKNYCTYLKGVDFSSAMLAQAVTKNVYDSLTNSDIIDFLAKQRLGFDYFVATDVFNYFGDLSPLFDCIKKRNGKSGKLVFSTEHLEDKGFNILPSGRFTHSKSYIQSLCTEYGYKLNHFELRFLRKSGSKVINGGIYLLDFVN